MQERARFATKMVWLVAMYVVVTYIALVMLGVAQIHVSHGPKAGQIFQEVAWFDRVSVEQREKLRTLQQQRDELKGYINVGRTELAEFAIASSMPEDKWRPVLDGKPAEGLDTTRLDLGRWARLVSSLKGWLVSLNHLDTAIADIERQLAESDPSSLGHVKTMAVVKSPADDELDSVRYTVRALKDFVFYPKILFLPVELLTLLLTLAMGALGSTLHATRVLVDRVKAGTDDDAPLRWFFFRPFQGMITACVIYIVFKAGQVTISSGDTDALNPFFVSFVAIISGMFVSEAYQAIGRAARGVLPTTEQAQEGERWGIGLKAAMDGQQITAETMAADLGRLVEDVQDWVGEAKPLSEVDQQLVAAYLRTRPRGLFTSEPPPQRAAEEQPQDKQEQNPP